MEFSVLKLWFYTPRRKTSKRGYGILICISNGRKFRTIKDFSFLDDGNRCVTIKTKANIKLKEPLVTSYYRLPIGGIKINSYLEEVFKRANTKALIMLLRISVWTA